MPCASRWASMKMDDNMCLYHSSARMDRAGLKLAFAELDKKLFHDPITIGHSKSDYNNYLMLSKMWDGDFSCLAAARSN